MLFERFEAEGLAHYSYAVGCPGAGEIAVVDPRRDIDVYLEYARANEVRIAHVLETHIHADYASGARQLAATTGATLWVSGYDRGETFAVSFAHQDMFDGGAVAMGAVRIEALHTPGHTPEHLSFLIYDGNRSQKIPMFMLSGDFLFVGSLGRPDLLGEEAKRVLARQLYDSTREKIAHLPDGLEIHPGHGAGSLCGAGISGRPVTTLGYERATNPYLAGDLDQDAFVARILATVPPFPDYYKRMKRVNSQGPTLFDHLPGGNRLDAAAVWTHVQAGHPVIDLRGAPNFSAGHIPGAFGIGAGASVSTWASWVVPYDAPLVLLVADEADVDPSIRSLVRVGLDDVRGYMCGLEDWVSAGHPVRTLKTIGPTDLHRSLQNGEAIRVLDVRNAEEWNAGHIANSVHIMAGQLPDQVSRLSRDDSPLAVICGSGYRSTVASSVLERAGFDNLVNIAGGIGAWKRADLPLTGDA